MTVNMEGCLDIWDFDSSNHVIYKVQSISNKILGDAICSPTLSLFRNRTSSRLFMILTSKNVLVWNEKKILYLFYWLFLLDYGYLQQRIYTSIHCSFRSWDKLGRGRLFCGRSGYTLDSSKKKQRYLLKDDFIYLFWYRMVIFLTTGFKNQQ